MRVQLLFCAFVARETLLGGSSNRSLGAVVEAVSPGFEAERAGLQPGDVMLEWRSATEHGTIRSYLHFDWIEIEKSPRGTITLIGRRRGQRTKWLLHGNDWGIKARPVLPSAVEQTFRGSDHAAAVDRANTLLASVSQSTGRDVDWLVTATRMYAAQILAGARIWKEADQAFREASLSARTGGPLALALVLRERALSLNRSGDALAAETIYKEAQAELAKIQARTLIAGANLDDLGDIALARRDLAQAEGYYGSAFELHSVLAPGSRVVAASLNMFGKLAFARSDLPTAEKYFLDAFAIKKRLCGSCLENTALLNNLGVVARNRGHLAEAEEYYSDALRLRQTAHSEDLDIAAILNNLGVVAKDRGDLLRAEAYQQTALSIRQQRVPGTLLHVASLSNLGVIAEARNDVDAAEQYFRKAFEIGMSVAPRSLETAAVSNNLGVIMKRRDDLQVAAEYFRTSLAIKKQTAPGSFFVAESERNLGDLSLSLHDFTKASEYYNDALEIRSRLAPEGLPVAESLRALGILARDRGERESAEADVRKSVAIYEKLVPGSAALAESVHDLAEIVRNKIPRIESFNLFARALDLLDSQMGRLGGTEEVRSGFRAKYRGYYADYIDLLVDDRRVEEAFHILERSRARSLLEMLAERDLLFTADLPAELRRARQSNAAAYDQAQAQIAKLNPAKDGAQIEQLVQRLRDLNGEREQIRIQVKAASPRLAALQYPEPLNAPAVRQVLDPGTLLMSYLVEEQRTLLFVVQPETVEPGVSVFELPVGDKALRSQVEVFRNLIQRRDEASRPALMTRARELYDLLVRPAEQLLGPRQRILICADGPLQTLPFAALRRNESEYLVDWKAVHEVISATVYAELKKMRRERRSGTVEFVAFGDPKYPGVPSGKIETLQNLELRSAAQRGFAFAALPASRTEVNSIAKIYPEHNQIFLGAEATEEQAKKTGENVRYIHFATHGVLDEHFPLNSALALTIPENPAEGQENGLLQAWEIFEQVHIDADLVTLSACETGLGQEIGGEGLIGLTRAFQYAGARSVLASLWNVADDSTADLMIRFYGHLKAGLSKDEALQHAQQELAHSSSYSHPFYWAAFSLSGDWR